MDGNVSAPAWHPDPSDPGRLRWWNGSAWTEHVSPAPGFAPPAAGVPPSYPGQPPVYGSTPYPGRPPVYGSTPYPSQPNPYPSQQPLAGRPHGGGTVNFTVRPRKQVRPWLVVLIVIALLAVVAVIGSTIHTTDENSTAGGGTSGSGQSGALGAIPMRPALAVGAGSQLVDDAGWMSLTVDPTWQAAPLGDTTDSKGYIRRHRWYVSAHELLAESIARTTDWTASDVVQSWVAKDRSDSTLSDIDLARVRTASGRDVFEITRTVSFRDGTVARYRSWYSIDADHIALLQFGAPVAGFDQAVAVVEPYGQTIAAR